MSDIPYWLKHSIMRVIIHSQASALLDWLQSNSNTVIVDELLLALKARRDFKELTK